MYIYIHLETYGGIWCHVEASGVIWRHPGATRRQPRGSQEAPRRHLGGTQEAPGGTKGTEGTKGVFDTKCVKNIVFYSKEQHGRPLSRRRERCDPQQVRNLNTKMRERKRGIVASTLHPFPRYTARTPTAEAVWGTTFVRT